MDSRSWFWAVWATPVGKDDQVLVEIFPPGAWQLAVKLAARLERKGCQNVEVLKEVEEEKRDGDGEVSPPGGLESETG